MIDNCPRRTPSAIRHRDWLQLHELLLEVHSAATVADLPGIVLTGMRRLIQYDSASVQDDRGGVRKIPWLYADQRWETTASASRSLGVRMMTHWDPEFTGMRDAFFAASAEKHPHTDYYRRTGDGSAHRLSDLVPMRALQHTTFFNEISRKNRLRWQLTAYMSLPNEGTLMVAACRRGVDFSNRDRSLLDLLRPHLQTAWHRALREQNRITQTSPRFAANSAEDPRSRLALRGLGMTARETDVLAWVAEGKTNGEIATILGLTPGTVKFYVERILAKLGCETRTAAARVAMEAIASAA